MTIILGIDPGSRITGYGLIQLTASGLEYVDSGCVRTTQDADLSQKLLEIYDGICHLMNQYSPDEVAIEDVFMHENARSALKLGHARGAAMVGAASHRIRVYEYSPRAIKQALVGYGAAEKSQVSDMVVNLLKLHSSPQKDAADGLAVAICHSQLRGKEALVRRKSGSRLRRLG